MSADIRVRLLEEDLDRTEERMAHDKNTLRQLVDGFRFEIQNEVAGIRTDMRDGFRECEERDDRTRKLLTGLLVSIVTLCVTVTVGVLVALGGG